MFESKTYEKLLEEKLARVPNTLDKREGAIIFDAVAPNSAEMAQAYIDLDTVMNQTYADTATGEWLEKRTSEHGVIREQATYAVVEGAFVPETISVIGKRFSCGLFNYIVTDTNKLTCETAGTEPNSVTGQLIPIEYIEGLESASITQVLIPAEDQEDDETLRERFIEAMRANAYGGNIADYKIKTNAIEGVGGTKVTPVWDGGGTVKLTIIASDYSVPTEYLVDQVQTIIDPTQDATGVAIAPIGHVVTVEGVVAKTINIVTTITYAEGWNWDSAKNYILEQVDAYLLDVAKGWKDNSVNVVRISQLEARILSLSSVIDIADTTLNGTAKNVQLEFREIPARGTFNGS